ncbi:2OG-Fe(II) oxygenase [Anabaena sp. UHCC 0253]|uniref:2OG-Fe(II) oxygenase n=1 Tax=Anabaena sp. UHCC 0253 TaxID=2590019 RepID=UPI001447196E|nr:2OG-Fe(II) oxygenase [Anabaena sp. UHCC 0253]
MNKILLKIRKKILRKIDTHPYTKHQADCFYQKAIEKNIHNLPPIPPKDLDLVERLKKEGVVITTLEKLKITSTPEMIESAQKLIPQISQHIFFQPNQIVTHASPQQIMAYPKIFLWGLEQRLLNIIEHFIGLPVAYQGAYFRRDIANGIEVGSRLWHIDQEDRKILKIIIYLHDVSEDHGPFQYIPKPFTSKIAQCLKYTSGYIQDKIMQGVISSSIYKSCTGIAGTVIIADTANIFHRGKPPIISDRFTIFFDYTTRRHKQVLYGTPTLAYNDLRLLSKNLSEAQKKCIFW